MVRLQINLLPDVKLKYLAQTRNRDLIVKISTIVSGCLLAIFVVLLLTVNVVQKRQLSSSGKAVTAAQAQLQNVKDLDKVLTVQNQLQTLVTLHKNKNVTSRIFGYLPQVTPTHASISRVSLDFTNDSLSMDGTADSQHTVNVFVDTLKFTTFKTTDQSTAQNAFSSVVESSFAIASQGVSFSLTAKFDPILFNNNLVNAQGKPLAPTLTVPHLTTTRSVTNDLSNSLFQGNKGSQ